MSVKFKVPPLLRKFINNLEEVETDGNNVGECIEDLDRQYPGFKRQLVDEKGNLNDVFEIYVNSNSAYPNELKYSVTDDDLVTIIVFAVGG